MARLDFGFADVHEGAGASVGADAMFELGLMYSAGRDVDIDLITAHRWFNLAALRGNEAAKTYRMEIARDLSRADVAKAQRLARQWLAAH